MLTLSINSLVVAAGEVDALKRAGFVRLGIYKWFFADLTMVFDDECVAGLEFLHLFVRRVENSLNGRAFGGAYNDFIVHVPKCRPDAVGVAHEERVAVAYEAAEYVAADKLFAGAAQQGAGFCCP
jgi:hypothetical protein